MDTAVGSAFADVVLITGLLDMSIWLAYVREIRSAFVSGVGLLANE